MGQQNFTFGIKPPGGGGSGFNSSNSYTEEPVNLIAGNTTVSTTMTVEPKFISVFDSSNNNITGSVGINFTLNAGFYDIIISSGVAINNCKVSSYGA